MWPLVLFLSVLCVGNSVAVYALWRKKQHLQTLQAQQQSQIEQHLKMLKHLRRRLETYLAGSMRMSEDLHELQRDLAPLPDKILRMEQRDPSTLPFTQAARLVGLGASVEDLKQSCGLTQSEAELLRHMHSKKSS